MNIDRHAKTITISQNTGVTVSVALLVMFSGAIFTGATWLADMRNRTTSLEGQASAQAADIETLKKDNVTSQVKFTEIQTQLKSIDTTLVEIKERL